jgi:N-acetylglucosaminyldiphosphoundecaprenol N-acetyl-beta-D-mannosaminyltransferase
MLVDNLEVLGLPLFAGSKQRFLITVGDRLSEGVATHVVTLNSEMVVNASRDSAFREALGKSDLIVPDGNGVVVAARFLRLKRIYRLPGIDLAEGIFKTAERSGRSVYLLGAHANVLEAAKARLLAVHPRLKIAGSHHGYFQGREEEVIQDIIASGADILLVGTGSPAQEYFIVRNRSRLPCKLFMGIGGSFDVWAGSRRRASKLMQRMGLEWLHRSILDVKRWPRLSFIPYFIWMVITAKVTGRNEA